MRIRINGEERVIERELTVAELLEMVGVKFREVGLAVAVNGEVIPKSQYAVRRIGEGDSVEIVQLVGGG
ncbi:MAG TPA: sulfur carrier protein ThiS [Aquifex aeolicus]|uniref:Sulfur carrier protein ThiS n=1 Tax=Aquifex aeolicus TaxID=63363 RepID=A0A7C5L2X5_AQUAO|nr:sulfur carrier protein ThiS [Aquifex aeolicus]